MVPTVRTFFASEPIITCPRATGFGVVVIGTSPSETVLNSILGSSAAEFEMFRASSLSVKVGSVYSSELSLLAKRRYSPKINIINEVIPTARIMRLVFLM